MLFYALCFSMLCFSKRCVFFDFIAHNFVWETNYKLRKTYIKVYLLHFNRSACSNTMNDHEFQTQNYKCVFFFKSFFE